MVMAFLGYVLALMLLLSIVYILTENLNRQSETAA